MCRPISLRNWRFSQHKYFVCLVLHLGKKLRNSPLQTPVRRAASQQAATAVFQLPEAPGMQREPRRAAAQACVREQRALSVPKKQPGGDFHPIGPNATAAAAAGRTRLGLWREPRDGALHGSTERTLCYEALCSVKPHSARASPCSAARRGTETDWKMEERSKMKQEKHCHMLCWQWWKVGKAENGIEAKHSVLICTHKMFSLSYVVKQKKKPLNAGLGVVRKKSHCSHTMGFKLRTIKASYCISAREPESVQCVRTKQVDPNNGSQMKDCDT